MNQTMEVGMGLKVTLIEQRAYVEYKLKKIILFNVSNVIFHFCFVMEAAGRDIFTILSLSPQTHAYPFLAHSVC